MGKSTISMDQMRLFDDRFFEAGAGWLGLP
jgi:hypothetical protein